MQTVYAPHACVFSAWPERRRIPARYACAVVGPVLRFHAVWHDGNRAARRYRRRQHGLAGGEDVSGWRPGQRQLRHWLAHAAAAPGCLKPVIFTTDFNGGLKEARL